MPALADLGTTALKYTVLGSVVTLAAFAFVFSIFVGFVRLFFPDAANFQQLLGHVAQIGSAMSGVGSILAAASLFLAFRTLHATVRSLEVTRESLNLTARMMSVDIKSRLEILTERDLHDMRGHLGEIDEETQAREDLTRVKAALWRLSKDELDDLARVAGEARAAKEEAPV